jgi:hypothetical protein
VSGVTSAVPAVAAMNIRRLNPDRSLGSATSVMNGLHDGSRMQARTACALEANEAMRGWFLAFGRLTRIGERQGLLRPIRPGRADDCSARASRGRKRAN